MSVSVSVKQGEVTRLDIKLLRPDSDWPADTETTSGLAEAEAEAEAGGGGSSGGGSSQTSSQVLGVSPVPRTVLVPRISTTPSQGLPVSESSGDIVYASSGSSALHRLLMLPHTVTFIIWVVSFIYTLDV